MPITSGTFQNYCDDSMTLNMVDHHFKILRIDTKFSDVFFWDLATPQQIGFWNLHQFQRQKD